MDRLQDDVVSEAVELSEAVFSYDGGEFEECYDGEADGFILVEDLRARMDEALIDSGNSVYLDDLPSFPDLGYDAESWARVFYSVEPGVSQADLAEVSDFSQGHMGNVLGDLESEGLVESSGSGRGKQYFYGENALPYLMILSEAEVVLEGDAGEAVDDLEEELPGSDDQEAEEEEEKDLQDIMMEVAEDEDDLETSWSQRDDGGLEARDHTDSDVDEDTSNPNEDEYYEGW